MDLSYFDKSVGRSSLEFVERASIVTILKPVNLAEFNIDGIITEIDKDIIANLGFKAIQPVEVILKAIIAWSMADEVGKAAIMVCCMNGNRHAKLLKKGKVDAAKFLSPMIVDAQSPTSLTLGRFTVALGCVFKVNFPDWHLKNSGHAAFSAKVFKKQFLNFLNIQLTCWKLYNPKKKMTIDIVNRTASIMVQQRASCVLFLSDDDPFAETMSVETFAANHGIEQEVVPAHNAALPCTDIEGIMRRIHDLHDADVRAVETRRDIPFGLIQMESRHMKDQTSSSSSSSSSAPAVTKKMRFKVGEVLWTLADGFYIGKGKGIFADGGDPYVDSEGQQVTVDNVTEYNIARTVN